MKTLAFGRYAWSTSRGPLETGANTLASLAKGFSPGHGHSGGHGTSNSVAGATFSGASPTSATSWQHNLDEKPPLTGIAAPVTYPLAGLASQIAVPAMSSGLAQRPAGMRAKTRSYKPGTWRRAPSVNSVSNQPGKSALTWMLSVAQARARLFVSWTMPPLLVA